MKICNIKCRSDVTEKSVSILIEKYENLTEYSKIILKSCKSQFVPGALLSSSSTSSDALEVARSSAGSNKLCFSVAKIKVQNRQNMYTTYNFGKE